MRGSAIADGASGGAIATVAMSAVMIVGERIGLLPEQPPTTITRSALGAVDVDLPAGAVSIITPITHLAFGVWCGVIFGLVRRLVPGAPGGLLGVIFGLAIWAISYDGWIPALGILPTLKADRPGRPFVMFIAHLVYGLVLGQRVRSPWSGPEQR